MYEELEFDGLVYKTKHMRDGQSVYVPTHLGDRWKIRALLMMDTEEETDAHVQ